jgi:hypothetical protein
MTVLFIQLLALIMSQTIIIICILCTLCCQFLCIVHFDCPFVILLRLFTNEIWNVYEWRQMRIDYTIY